MTLQKNALENMVGRGENAGNRYSLQQCFLPFPGQISILKQNIPSHFSQQPCITATFQTWYAAELARAPTRRLQNSGPLPTSCFMT